MARRGGNGGNDKYLRLTGLWQSKKNNSLFTGKLKTEQLEGLEKKVAEALESDAPLLFGLWENDKKESKRDPEFSLQCFVGDSEEKPTSRRASRRDEEEEEAEEAPRKKRKPVDEEPEEEEPEEEVEEEEDKPKRKTSSRTREAAPAKKKRADW